MRSLLLSMLGLKTGGCLEEEVRYAPDRQAGTHRAWVLKGDETFIRDQKHRSSFQDRGESLTKMEDRNRLASSGSNGNGKFGEADLGLRRE